MLELLWITSSADDVTQARWLGGCQCQQILAFRHELRRLITCPPGKGQLVGVVRTKGVEQRCDRVNRFLLKW